MQKQKRQFQTGFTLMELLVVIAIMVLMATILIVNFNRQRGIRDLKIAQNKFVTDIRKAQSYILSARNLSNNGVLTPAKYYHVEVSSGASQYFVKGITDAYFPLTVETITLPQGIIISNVAVSGACPASCTSAVRTGFGAPFGKVYVQTSNDACGSTGFYVAVQSPSCLLTLADRQVVITLQDTRSLATKTVTISGVSGKVEAGP